MNRLRRAVPICREHSLRVNARVVAWAVVEGLLSAPVLGLLLFTVPAAVVGEALLAVVDAVASAGGWFHDRAGRIARGRKWRVHNAARRRRVCEWVGRLSGIPVPTPDELGRGFDVGNGISAHWRRGPDVRLMPGHHFAPLFDDDAFAAAAAEAEGSRAWQLEREGHAPHCASRIVWGDGECECGGDPGWIRGDTIARAALGVPVSAYGGKKA